MAVPTNEELQAGMIVLYNELQKRGVVLSGAQDPTVVGVFAPVGANYIMTFGGIQVKRFQKFGTGNTDWGEVLSASGGSAVEPIEVNASTFALSTWASRDVVVTSAATITLPTTSYAAPNGFYFNLFRDTPGVVQVITEGGTLLKSSVGGTILGFSNQNSWMSVAFIRGFWCAEGRLVDLSL